MKRMAIVAAVMACAAENVEPPPDAAIQMAMPDACTREPTDGCCALLPDENAARKCVADASAPGSCGVLVCWASDCTNTKLNFCAPD